MCVLVGHAQYHPARTWILYASSIKFLELCKTNDALFYYYKTKTVLVVHFSVSFKSTMKYNKTLDVKQRIKNLSNAYLYSTS